MKKTEWLDVRTEALHWEKSHSVWMAKTRWLIEDDEKLLNIESIESYKPFPPFELFDLGQMRDQPRL